MSLIDNQQLFKNNMLDDIVDSYHHSTDIRVEVIDSSGNIVRSYGEKPKLCSFFINHIKCNPCKEAHLKAAKQAVIHGDAYIFFCPAGLTHYVSPLLHNKTFYGALVAGPVMMEHPNELFIDDFMKNFNIDLDYGSLLLAYLRQIPLIGPTKVRHYSKLLFYLSLSALQSQVDVLQHNKDRANQQSRISEAIHSSKSELSSHYPYDKEKELYAKVRSGDIVGAKTLLNEILGHIFFAQGRNLSAIKSRLIELCAVLSRAAVEGGASIDEIFKTNSRFINELSTAEDIEELSFWLLKVLHIFTENVLSIAETKNKDLLEVALRYIHQNYASNLSLALVADKVHLNHTYFSTLFKKETGLTLTQYVNSTRVKAAKHLLSSTNNSILEVAIAVGFEDQSYFCKVFRRFTGVTPTQYRNLESMTL